MEPPAGSAGAPRVRATTRSPKAAQQPGERRFCRLDAISRHGPRIRGNGRRLSPCGHGDPLPRRRDHRDRVAVPARHGSGPRPHRLRHVPGQPQRVDPQPDPVRLRAVGAGRRAADPRPPGPLRPAAGPRPRGLHAARSTPPPGPWSWRRSCCWTPGISTRSSPSATPAGRSATRSKVAADDRKQADAYQAALDLAEDGEDGVLGGPAARPRPASTSRRPSSPTERRRRPTPGRATPRRSCAPSPPRSTSTSTRRSTRSRTPRRVLPQFSPVHYGEELEVAPGRPRHVPRCRPHPRLGDHPGPRHGRTTAARSASSCSRATSGGPARRSCATRRS